MFVHTHSQVADDSETASRPADAAVGVQKPSVRRAGSSLRLRLSYPDPRVAVLSAAGELDLATTPQLAQLLWPRLQTMLSGIIFDFSDLRFLGVTGLELLDRAHTYADHRDIALSVVTRQRTVHRALAAGGLEGSLPCFATVSAARIAAGDEPERPHPAPVETSTPAQPGHARTDMVVVQP